MSAAVRPLLKWPGGKRWSVETISQLFPRPFQGYYEPLFGGGAVFFYLYSIGCLPDRVVISDVNEELMTCYQAVRDDPKNVIDRLRWHERMYSREHYYDVRAWDRTPGFTTLPAVDRAARTIFLNRTCYNGLYRTNRNGQFNVPFGRYEKVNICDPDHIRSVSRAMRRADIRCCDFADALATMQPGDVAYLDPPYDSLDGKGFTDYTRQGFSRDDQIRLSQVALEMQRRGAFVVLSNADTPMIRDLYRTFICRTVSGRRSINCQGNRRSAVRELLAIAADDALIDRVAHIIASLTHRFDKI